MLQNQDQQEARKYIGGYSYIPKFITGEGAFSKVYKGLVDETQEVVAIKQLDLRIFNRDEYLKQSLNQEIGILKKLNHSNILKFIDLIQTERNIYIITEFCQHGDLRNLMQQKQLSTNECIDIIRQVLTGFKELVRQNVIHRDLKPANILVHNGLFKIADFGFAKLTDYNSQNAMMQSCVGTPYYMSPQILKKIPYTIKCDIWSIGIIFFEMLTGDVPYIARSESDLLHKILTLPIKYNMIKDQNCIDIIKLCLVLEEDNRISWQDLFLMFDSKFNQQQQIPQQLLQQPQPQLSQKIQPQIKKVNNEQQLQLENEKKNQEYNQKQLQLENEKKSQEFQKLIKSCRIIREEIILMHYSCVLLLQGAEINLFTDKDISYEKALLLLSLMVQLNSQMMINSIKLNNKLILNFMDKQALDEYLNKIDEEHKCYSNMVNDIYNWCKKIGYHNDFKSDPELNSFINRLQESDLQKINDNFIKNAEFTADQLMNQIKKMKYEDISSEVINLLDLLLDVLTLKKIKDKSFDCSKVFLEKSITQDRKSQLDRINKKFNKVQGGFLKNLI